MEGPGTPCTPCTVLPSNPSTQYVPCSGEVMASLASLVALHARAAEHITCKKQSRCRGKQANMASSAVIPAGQDCQGQSFLSSEPSTETACLNPTPPSAQLSSQVVRSPYRATGPSIPCSPSQGKKLPASWTRAFQRSRTRRCNRALPIGNASPVLISHQSAPVAMGRILPETMGRGFAPKNCHPCRTKQTEPSPFARRNLSRSKSSTRRGLAHWD